MTKLFKAAKNMHNASMTIPADRHTALMWYYLSWTQKIKHWKRPQRMKYAKELSKLSSIIPFWMYPRPPAQINKTLKQEGINLIRARGREWLITDEEGHPLHTATGLGLQALFTYLIRQEFKDAEDLPEWVYNAEALARNER